MKGFLVIPGLFQGNKDHPAIFYTLFPSDILRLLTRRLAPEVVLKFHQVPYHAQFIFPRNCKNVIGLDNMGGKKADKSYSEAI